MSPSDYTVLYFDNTDDQLVDASNAINNRLGGAPESEGSYTLVVIDKASDPLSHDASANLDLSDYTGASDFEVRTQSFKVAEAAKTLEGAYAYEGTNTADTSFKYGVTGEEIAFAVGGTKLTSSDYTAKVLSGNSGSLSGTLNAGDYKVLLTGKGAYAGTTETVEFTVDPIDLSKDVVTIKAGAAGMTFSSAGVVDQSANTVYVNGDPIDTGLVNVNAIKFTNKDGGTNDSGTWTGAFASSNFQGIWDLVVSDADVTNAATKGNVVGDPVNVKAVVTTYDVVYSYGSDECGNDAGDAFENPFVANVETFNPLKLSAEANGAEVDFTYTVTKDGEKVDSFTEPGEYVLTMTTPLASDFSYGGTQSFKFEVQAKQIGDVTVFATIDGKVMGASDYYTGEAFEPVLAVKDGKTTLVEGEDYVVTYEKDGEEVESMVEPGAYKIVVSFPGSNRAENPYEIPFTINKAQIAEIRAAADFFATDGETAAAPTFVASTESGNDFYKGLVFDLKAEEISVKYTLDGTAVKAEDLVEAGDYVADVNILSTVALFEGSDSSVDVKVAEQVRFSDVDANAWYAESVYTAAQTSPVMFGYMTGVGDTNLFMPNAEITRAEVAQVFANMAGQTKATNGAEYPTKFSDVDKAAWYAKAIAWASQAGIVGGYEGTDVFGTFDNATREQIATMIYRYAKAQGMDVAVEDEAKALSAYADADQLTFGKTAMAWCVEQGIFGVDTDALRPADNMSRAEMAATSVRVQPDGAKKALV